MVHSHVQRRVLEAEGKAPFRSVELVGGYSQVRQDSVHVTVSVVTDEIVHETEIPVHCGQPSVFRCVCQRFLVLVKCNKTALGTEAAQNLATVSPSSEGRIHVDPVFADGKRLYALVEQDRRVIFRYGRLLFR